jgi:hypothetical protein
MNASDATMLYYRGYLIEARIREGAATRESPPASVPGPWEVWVVIRSTPSGAYEEVGILNSEGAARKLIDELTTPALLGAGYF